MNKMTLFSIAAFAAMLSTGCAFSSNRSAAGAESRTMITPFFVVERKDTTIGQKDCEEAMTTIHPGEQPMVRKDFYASCFTVGMMDVDQNNQLPPPLPRDLNGDGKPDAMEYQNGVRVPLGLYNAFPGMYWPAEYEHYGFHQRRIRTIGSHQPTYTPYMPHPYGYHSGLRARGTVVGHPGDAAVAGTSMDFATKYDIEQAEIKNREQLRILSEVVMGEPEEETPKSTLTPTTK